MKRKHYLFYGDLIVLKIEINKDHLPGEDFSGYILMDKLKFLSEKYPEQYKTLYDFCKAFDLTEEELSLFSWRI